MPWWGVALLIPVVFSVGFVLGCLWNASAYDRGLIEGRAEWSGR